MSQRRLATLVGGSLLALSALLVMSGAAVASNSQAAPAAVVTPSPVPPSGPFIKCGGTVEFTNVPAGWYLVVEPGDHLITSGFDAIALAPGDYTYEFRDAGANDQLGGAFTVDPCSTPTPTPTPTPTQTFNPCASLPIPQAVVTASPISCASPFQSFQGQTSDPTPPPTSTNGDTSGGSSTPLFALLISLAFGGLGLAAIEAQRRSIRR